MYVSLTRGYDRGVLNLPLRQINAKDKANQVPMYAHERPCFMIRPHIHLTTGIGRQPPVLLDSSDCCWIPQPRPTRHVSIQPIESVYLYDCFLPQRVTHSTIREHTIASRHGLSPCGSRRCPNKRWCRSYPREYPPGLHRSVTVP
jgi:hypothetical protein